MASRPTAVHLFRSLTMATLTRGDNVQPMRFFELGLRSAACPVTAGSSGQGGESVWLLRQIMYGGKTNRVGKCQQTYAARGPMAAFAPAMHEVVSGVTTRELYDGSPIEEVD